MIHHRGLLALIQDFSDRPDVWFEQPDDAKHPSGHRLHPRRSASLPRDQFDEPADGNRLGFGTFQTPSDSSRDPRVMSARAKSLRKVTV
jgi:hypothetical protein